MEYKRIGNRAFVRIDRGEEITEAIHSLAEQERIKLATVSAIGAVGDFTVGVFKTATKEYVKNTFSGDYEIVSLCGTISTMDGNFYCHLHLSAGDEGGVVVGGHLNRAVVSATCEMVVDISEGILERSFDEKIGLNTLDFNR